LLARRRVKKRGIEEGESKAKVKGEIVEKRREVGLGKYPQRGICPQKEEEVQAGKKAKIENTRKEFYADRARRCIGREQKMSM